MRKSGNQNKSRKGKRVKKQAEQTAAPADITKRRSLKRARNGFIVIALLGIAGYFAVSGYLNFKEEKDLTKIGNGKPSIVQIHDPNCPVCNELQVEARKALTNFDDDTYNYLVADLRTSEGSVFARKHAQQRITLMLFNGRGQVKQVLRGPRQAEELTNAFGFVIGK